MRSWGKFPAHNSDSRIVRLSDSRQPHIASFWPSWSLAYLHCKWNQYWSGLGRIISAYSLFTTPVAP